MDCQVLGQSLCDNSVLPSLDLGVVAAGVTSGVKQPLYLGISARLELVRISSDLFQSELSEKAGLGRGTARKLETRERCPNIETVERIACVLGISPTWLAFGFDGFEPWRERVPRKGEAERPAPTPNPGARPCPEMFRGIPERLRLAREQSGLSMRAIARATELSAQTVALIEAGRSVPLISNIEAIAKALSVSPGWLAFGEIDEGE